MKKKAADPRITAYALGEMNATEMAEFQREMQADPELQEEVEEMGRLSRSVEEALASEPWPRLSAVQNEILRPHSGSEPPPAITWSRLGWIVASLLLLIGLFSQTKWGISIADKIASAMGGSLSPKVKNLMNAAGGG